MSFMTDPFGENVLVSPMNLRFLLRYYSVCFGKQKILTLFLDCITIRKICSIFPTISLENRLILCKRINPHIR
jgi:hypothetical protein